MPYENGRSASVYRLCDQLAMNRIDVHDIIWITNVIRKAYIGSICSLLITVADVCTCARVTCRRLITSERLTLLKTKQNNNNNKIPVLVWPMSPNDKQQREQQKSAVCKLPSVDQQDRKFHRRSSYRCRPSPGSSAYIWTGISGNGPGMSELYVAAGAPLLHFRFICTTDDDRTNRSFYF